MTRIIYYTQYNPEVDGFDDWRIQALNTLEKDVLLYAYRYHIINLTQEDVEQELRYQLWRKLPLFNPNRSSIRTWAWLVMRSRLIDLDQATKKKNHDCLDNPNKMPLIDDEISDWL